MWGSARRCHFQDAGQLQDQSRDSKHPKKSFCSSALGHPLEKGLDIPVPCLGTLEYQSFATYTNTDT